MLLRSITHTEIAIEPSIQLPDRKPRIREQSSWCEHLGDDVQPGPLPGHERDQGVARDRHAQPHERVEHREHLGVHAGAVQRVQRLGIRSPLTVDHLLASSAIPFVFPPIRIHREYFGDGSMRHLAPHAAQVIGLEYDFERAAEAGQHSENITNAAGEHLPFPAESFSLILSHEVLEHVQDDRLAVEEMVRVLQPGGRITLFVPNRGYPFETHGIYWRGKYHFGNIPLVNYLPRRLRDRLAPHVRIYTAGDVRRLFAGLPVRTVEHTILFGAYDNIIARRPRLGKLLRVLLQFLERTPLRCFGLSHFWVLEKLPRSSPG